MRTLILSLKCLSTRRRIEYLISHLRIDDPLDAFPVHGVCGFWGLIAVGIYSHEPYVEQAHSTNVAHFSRSKRFGIQVSTFLNFLIL